MAQTTFEIILSKITRAEEFILQYMQEKDNGYLELSQHFEKKMGLLSCFSAIMDVTMFSQSKGCIDLG